MVRILKDLISDICRTFLDNFVIKDLSINYDREKIEYNMRYYVVKYFQNIDKILINCELVRITVLAVKSKWCSLAIKIVGYLYRNKGRLSAKAKVYKIKI